MKDYDRRVGMAIMRVRTERGPQEVFTQHRSRDGHVWHEISRSVANLLSTGPCELLRGQQGTAFTIHVKVVIINLIYI